MKVLVVHLDHNLCKMLLLHHITIGILHFFQSEHLIIQRQINPPLLHRSIHLAELPLRAQNHASEGAHVPHAVHDAWNFRIASAAQYTRDTNYSIHADSFDGLPERGIAANIDHVVEAATLWREGTGFRTPIRLVFVIDDMFRSELPQLICFRLGARGGNAVCASSVGKLSIPV